LVIGDWWLAAIGAEAPAAPPFRRQVAAPQQSPATNHHSPMTHRSPAWLPESGEGRADDAAFFWKWSEISGLAARDMLMIGE